MPAPQKKQLAELGQRVTPLEQRQTELDQRQAEWDQRQAELDQRQAELDQRQAELDRRQAEVGQRQDQLDQIQADLSQRQIGLDQRQAGLGQQQAQLGRQLGRFEPVKADLSELHRRLDKLQPIRVELDVLRRRLARLQPAELDLPEFYADFEERFRGAPELTRERQQDYLPFIEAAGAGTLEAPVLDLGCGRGQWLTLLREHGKFARGVDLNEPLLDRCRELGLQVTQANALQDLEACEPGSLGAVTGFHLIEHMPAYEQIRLVQLAFRALRPGGVLILETPNLDHLTVAARDFYLDPARVRPVPGELLEFAARQFGFGDVRTEGRSPGDDREAAQGWSRYEDLALIAIRPAAAAV